MGAEYEDLVLRIMVQEELYPNTERTAVADLAQSFRETFKCRCSLSTYFSIVHCFDSRLEMTT